MKNIMVRKCFCLLLILIVFSTILTTLGSAFIDRANVATLEDLDEKWNLGNPSLIGMSPTVACSGSPSVHMDISFNNFTRNIPSSFGSLKSPNRLFLQNNNFSGLVAYVDDHPLTDLNVVRKIPRNLFSGIILSHFQLIPNLWVRGNKYHAEGNSPPLDSSTQANAIKNNYSSHKKKLVSARQVIAFILGVTRLAIFFAFFMKQLNKERLESFQSSHSSFQLEDSVMITIGDSPVAGEETPRSVLPLTTSSLMPSRQLPCSFQSDDSVMTTIGDSSVTQEETPRSFMPLTPTSPMPPRQLPCSLQSDDLVMITIGDSPVALEETPRSVLPLTPTSLMPPRRLPPLFQYITQDMLRRRVCGRTKIYSLAELQTATNSFSEDNFLGEGSLGSVYIAVLPDGRTLAVKNINMDAICLYEEETFLDVVSISSCLKHPNIIELKGYSVKRGHRLLVYEYVRRHLTLYDALHNSDAFMPLTWSIRLRIALGVADALNYMHSAFSPPVAHGKLMASNILLDENLMPRVCDCGLAILRPMMSYKVRGAAEGAAGCYISAEQEPGISCNTKDDVYAFGVLLLQLLTGRTPYDGSKPEEEQYLATWASVRLHDNESLIQMVDPIMKGYISTKALSCYANIVSLCIHPVLEFRPIMSTVVESLTICSKNY